MEVLAIVLPVILMMGIGKFLGISGLIDDHTVAGIKAIISNIMLPVTLFDALAMTIFQGKDMLLVGACFVAFCAILGVAFLLRPLFGEYKTYAPFLCCGIEGGMLCYSLYMTIYGSESLGTLLRIDLANILFAFTVFLFMIKSVGQGNVDLGQIAKDYTKNPVVIGIVLGIIASLTGLGQALAASSIYTVYAPVKDMITAPLGALVLITVGYGLEFDKDILAAVVKVSAVRLILNAAALSIIVVLFKSYWVEQALLVAITLEFFMPAQFITPIYIDDEKQQKFASTQLSCYSLIAIAAFVVINVAMPK